MCLIKTESFSAAVFGWFATDLIGAGGVNMASVLPWLPLDCPTNDSPPPRPPPHPTLWWWPKTFHRHLLLKVFGGFGSLTWMFGPAVKTIQGHLFLQELANDASHHHFPISDPSVCFYQFVTNTVLSICYKFWRLHSWHIFLIHIVGQGKLGCGKSKRARRWCQTSVPLLVRVSLSIWFASLPEP